MGLPKPNRYQPAAGFRKMGSLNGRSWLKMDKTSKFTQKNNSNYALKPKISEVKKQDALYRHQLFLQRLSATKSNKIAGALKNKPANKQLAIMDSSKGFLTFSPWDSRFPKFFESFSPFDACFEEFAKDKIYQSFSPFDRRFPNYPYKKKYSNFKKGFQSFSPFDTRFPKNFESYSPFDSRFPVAGTHKPYPTYSPFDTRFPKYTYTKMATKKQPITKGASTTTIALNKLSANKRVAATTSAARLSITPALMVAQVPMKNTTTTTPKASKKQMNKKPTINSKTANQSTNQSPKASQTPVNFFTASRTSATQTPTNKKTTTSTASTGTTFTMPSPQIQQYSYMTAPATASFVQRPTTSATSSSIRFPQAAAPVAAAPIFLPTTTAAPLTDAFPRFTPMARNTQQQTPSFYRPQMSISGRNQGVSPMSSVLQNGGGYVTRTNNSRFGAM